MNAYELNMDGLVGQTHHYAGLSSGNIASTNNALSISNPQAAARQGLEKMRQLYNMGLKQGLLPPHQRPNLNLLYQLGFKGSPSEQINKAYKTAPELLSACYSASSMWTANAATVSASVDTEDNKVHFTAANLISNLHRHQEADLVTKLLNLKTNNESQNNDIDMAFTRPEGRLIQSIHLRRERNFQLINEAKKLFKKTHGGKLFCEICRFSFEEVYGSIGENFIEAHHIIPVSQMKIDHRTSISELMMLCSNCHRMAHRENGMETLQDIKKSFDHEKNQ